MYSKDSLSSDISNASFVLSIKDGSDIAKEALEISELKESLEYISEVCKF
jgi:hypothetical protein